MIILALCGEKTRKDSEHVKSLRNNPLGLLSAAAIHEGIPESISP